MSRINWPKSRYLVLPGGVPRYKKQYHTTTVLKDTKKSDRASKSVWGASEINVGNDYKPGGTAMVAFGKTAKRVFKQGIDDLGRWSWMAFEGVDNKVILIMSIYQCCKNQTNHKERRLITNKKQCYQKGIEMIMIQEETSTKICVNFCDDLKRRQSKRYYQYWSAIGMKNVWDAQTQRNCVMNLA